MIARIWHGVVPAALTEPYASYIEETGTREARRTPGNRGVLVLRRVAGPEAHFVFASFWDTLRAIRGFAGEDVGRARYYPRDREFLVELEPHVAHYEVVDSARADPPAGLGGILRLPG